MIAWGFTYDTDTFVSALDKEIYEAENSGPDLGEWVRKKESWVQEGVQLMQHMEGMVFGDMSNTLTMDELRFIWRVLSRVAYEVQYLIVLVEYRLDTVQ